MNTKKRILIAPLNWGLGHATRCIPIINALLKNNFEVIISANGRSHDLLKKEFPLLEFINIKGIEVKYHKFLPMNFNIILQTPKILYAIYSENTAIKKIIKKYKIDGIISDNRFGLFNKNVKSVFITHQLQIQSRYMQNIIQRMNYFFINQFNICWIIDDQKKNLAGDLSKPKKLPTNYKYIGLHSRLSLSKKQKKYKLCFIISGPEPQRTIFEEIIIKSTKKIKEKTIIILGKPEEEKNIIKKRNLTIISSADTKEINKCILESEIIISRSGYSTIMDLEKTQSKAIFVPTPGQTEQEYLARYLKKKKIADYQIQNKFDLNKGIDNCKNYSGFISVNNHDTNWEKLFNLFKNKGKS